MYDVTDPSISISVFMVAYHSPLICACPWTSLEQSHQIFTFLPSKVPWGPYGPLGVKVCMSLDVVTLLDQTCI